MTREEFQKLFERNMKILGVELDKQLWPLNEIVKNEYGKPIYSRKLGRNLTVKDTKAFYDRAIDDIIGVTLHNAAFAGDVQLLHNYGLNGDENKDPNLVNLKSWDLSVGEKKVIQGGWFNHSTFHAGDGTGNGNMKTISMEMTRDLPRGNKLYYVVEDNGLRTAAALLQALGIMTADINKAPKGKGLFTHEYWTRGAGCPHRILEEGRWPAVVKKCQTYIDQINKNLKDDKKPSKPKPKPDPKPDQPVIDHYRLQVRAASEDDAQVIKDRAKNLGFAGPFSYPTVQLGAFKSEQSAEKYKRRAEKLGIKDVEIIPIKK